MSHHKGQTEKKSLNSSRRYRKIYYEERMELIRLVCEEKVTCAIASRKLGISPSTAKMIIKNFQ